MAASAWHHPGQRPKLAFVLLFVSSSLQGPRQTGGSLTAGRLHTCVWAESHEHYCRTMENLWVRGARERGGARTKMGKLGSRGEGCWSVQGKALDRKHSVH